MERVTHFSGGCSLTRQLHVGFVRSLVLSQSLDCPSELLVIIHHKDPFGGIFPTSLHLIRQSCEKYLVCMWFGSRNIIIIVMVFSIIFMFRLELVGRLDGRPLGISF